MRMIAGPAGRPRRRPSRPPVPRPFAVPPLLAEPSAPALAEDPAPATDSPDEPEPAPRPRSRLFYGWVMLPVAALLHAGTGVGQTYGVSVFNPRILEDLRLSETALSLSYMIACLAAATPLPLVGLLTDKYGLRLVAVWVVIGLAGGCWLTGSATNVYTLTAGFFLLRLLGQGALSLVASNTPAMWFDRRLGLAGGLVGLGQSVGFAVLPALFLFVVTGYEHTDETGGFDGLGWRNGYQFLGLANTAILLPVLWLVYRNRPADVGQRVDGGPTEEEPVDADAPDAAPPNAQSRPSLTAPQAYRTFPFWFAAGAQATWAMIGTALFYHLLTILGDRGVPETDAAFCFTVFAVAMAAGQFGGGLLADRIRPRFLVSLFGLLATAGCGLLYLTHSSGAAWTFAGVLGLAQGLLTATMNVLWPRFFGTAALGAIRGTVQTLGAAACAVGPVIVAYSREGFGSEEPALLLFAVLLLTIAATAPFLRPPARG